MSTPLQRSALTDLDPLSPSSAAQPAHHLSPVRPSTSSPLSFKRRSASQNKQSVSAKASSLLGGLLSRSQEEERDMLPPTSTSAGRPTPQQKSYHLSLPRRDEPRFRHPSESGFSNAITTDTEDDDEEEEDGGGVDDEDADEDLTHSTIEALGWRGWKRRRETGASQAGRAGGGGLEVPPGGRGSFAGSARPRRWVSGSVKGGEGGGGGPPDEAGGEGWAEGGPVVATPLPKIPIAVLSIAMFGEFLSAAVCSPFLFFMVESFGVGAGANGGGESAVSLWTGVVSAVFFLSQFLTAMIWVNVAEKHGRRAVLCASLIGNGLSVMAFGTSKNLGTAITTRLALGLFNGAVGVARSAVQDVTDETNRSAAYTVLGLVWSLGGIAGSVLGGTLEHPVDKFPSYFGDSELFARNPYLLPCLCAGSVTLFGGFLSLFLNRDGGQRTGGIHLPTEKDVEVAATTLSKLKTWLSGLAYNLCARISRRPPISLSSPEIGNVSLRPSHATIPPLPSPAPSPSLTDNLERNPLHDRRASATARQYGSAYGYSRHPSVSGFGGTAGESGLRIPSMRRRGLRTFSMATSNRYDPENEIEHSFAERLLLANNAAVFSLSDVFLAKAAADDVRSTLEYEGSILERDEDEESRIDGTDLDANSEYGDVGFGSAPPSMDDLRGEAARQDIQRAKDASSAGPPRPTSPTFSAQRRPSILTSPSRDRVPSFGPSLARLRRGSASSVRPFSIYSNTGLAPETIALSANQLSSGVTLPGGQSQSGQGAAGGRPDESGFARMQAIPETRPPSIVDRQAVAAEEGVAGEGGALEGGAGLIWQLPLGMIFQYFCVGLHGTACDQVFGSFLVTKVASGGLGLSAQHYSLLVAIMFFFQLVWNFRFYPAVGPPNGPLSHLSMFRLGLLLYVPVYLLFPELRGLIIVEGEDALVMTGMVVLSAIRYLANACAYTSVMVLINVMSPPELVPLANGLAQSSISLARTIGPLLGGSIFAASIADGPNAHPWPFNYAAGFVLVATVCFSAFLLSWRIR
ncbi:hypothetical protein JCM8097_002555 [Rhodosporidiobolus ruineniae]